ncbi:Amino acid permease 6 [Camellia lanceoleosa]|uniref:Amino acid permease 6 n=1 Tax=Camellia lanceoleosa TaxID=1840588 RepID=A0ACC0GY17_9ERIC|nr:Amino acid permease 6 [Camellia lanceoleosa]
MTGVTGSGVLSLAWSVAKLGWIADPLCIMVFGVIAVVVHIFFVIAIDLLIHIHNNIYFFFL